MMDKTLTRLAALLFGERHQSAQITAPQPDAPLPEPVLFLDPARTWRVLPGQRLELGSTGFQISLHPETPVMLYQLWGPEGEALGGCSCLATLKAHGVAKAKEREEFACAPPTKGVGE